MLIKDKTLKTTGNSKEEEQDFYIAWLSRRVENLEAIVFELLRDKLNYGLVEGYQKSLDNPGFGPSSDYLKDFGKRFASHMQQDFPPENLQWPEKEKWPKDQA